MYLQHFRRQLYRRPFVFVLALIIGCIAITTLNCVVNPRRRVQREDTSGQLILRGTQLEQLPAAKVELFNEGLYGDIWNFRATAPPTTDPGKRATHGIGRICSQQERITHVQDVCRRLNRTKTSPSSHSIVDHKHRLLVCWMSKIGCTALKSTLLEANGCTIGDTDAKRSSSLYVHSRSFLSTYGLQMVQDINSTILYSIMNDYFKMVTVRHPFERLLSTYRGKIVDQKSELKHLVREILRETRPTEFEKNSLAEMDDFTVIDRLGVPTFTEFLAWIKASKNANEHWSVMNDDCHICSHDWSAILRLETMNYDQNVLLEKLAPDVASFPVRHSHRENATPVHSWMIVPEYDGVDESVIDYFMELYKDDMEVFGYKWDGSEHVASCEIQTQSGICC